MTAFDTLKLARTLQAGDFNQTQAETLSSAIAEAIANEIVTKSDLREQLTALRSDLREDMAKWVFGASFLQLFAIIGAVLALRHFGK